MREENQYFVLTLPLCLEPWQADRLDKALEVNRRIYNALLREGMKRCRQMQQTRLYRELWQELSSCNDTKRRKQLYRQLDGLKEQYRLRLYDFSRDSTAYRKYFRENTDAPIVQNLAVRVNRAIQNLLAGKAEQVFYKPKDGLCTISGKTNQTSIRLQDGQLLWKDLRMKILWKHNVYEQEALEQKLCFCRIKRKQIRGKWRYDAELVLNGRCPVKRRLPTAASGPVGIRRLSGSISAVSKTELLELRLPRSTDNLEQERKALARSMERSRRCTNPENYEADGRICKGRKGPLFWKQSINYRNLKKKYAEILRLQRVRREERQRVCMEQLLELGTHFVWVETSGKGRPGKRRGRSIEEIAPSAFFQKFQWKLLQQGRTCAAVSKREFEALFGNYGLPDAV